ncbi:MAG: glycosyltransferase family 2 protein [Pseudomonadota bacterium]
MPSVSVVLPTRNRGEDLRLFLDSLVIQTVMPDELVVVDSGESVEALLREALEGSGIDLIYARSAPGTSLQRNVGIDLSRGEILFFLDDDMVLEPDYIARTLEAFEVPMEPPVGGVMGSHIHFALDPPLKRRLSHLLGLPHTAPGDASLLYVTGGVRWLTEPSGIVPIPAAATGRVAYRRACLEQERFAEFLPGYTFAEDVELAFRIAKRWTIVHQPAARLDHRHSEAARVGYGDRIARVMFARWYFFANHREKTPKNLLSFAIAHTAETAQLTAMVLRQRRDRPAPTARGVARGYRLCAQDLAKRLRG